MFKYVEDEKSIILLNKRKHPAMTDLDQNLLDKMVTISVIGTHWYSMYDGGR
jgi:hypothetical protein